MYIHTVSVLSSPSNSYSVVQIDLVCKIFNTKWYTLIKIRLNWIIFKITICIKSCRAYHYIPNTEVYIYSGRRKCGENHENGGGVPFKRPRMCIVQRQAGKQRNSRWRPQLFITIWSRKVAQIITARMQMRWSPTW